MLRLGVGLVGLAALGVASTASAQALPAPGNTARPDVAPTYVDDSEPEAAPWEVRGLPPCRGDEPAPAPGQPYACRPSYAVHAPPGSLTLALGLGAIDSDVPVLGNLFTGAVGIDWGFGRNFSVGFRYQAIVAADEGFDGDGDGIDDVNDDQLAFHLFAVGPRLRLFTDETARQAWIFEADAGFAVNSGLGPSMPMFRAAIGREFGIFPMRGFAYTFGAKLEYMQGLDFDDRDTRALALTFHQRFEWNPPEPLDIGEEPTPAGFDYTVGGRMGIGFLVGGETVHQGITFAALTFGVPLAPAIEPRVQVDASYLGSFSKEDGIFTFGALGGLRVRGPLFYIDALAGYQMAIGTEPRAIDSGPVFDVGIGFQYALCQGAVDFGLHYRHGLDDGNEDLHSMVIVIGGQYGSSEGSLGGNPFGESCGGTPYYTVGTVPQPYTWSPSSRTSAPVTTTNTATTTIDTDANVDANVDANAAVAANVQTQVQVDVQAQVGVQPIRIEVPLGIALLGGLVQLRIDVGALPLAQLRAAASVQIAIEGPASALAQAEAQMRASLGADGARVSSWSRVETRSNEIRAVFTITPARP